ncbi:glucose 1-dehydrogenase [Streptomyces fuscichromogenes]|uniref:glucose 1-dehydrogenase n=1 Tax=Streptomyces fuscichromogenes TaxID=1324013 RepID=UPI00380E727C
MAGRVEGKVALVSGGARGMGASHARTLVAEGARVVIGDVLDAEGAGLADELGDAAVYTHLDVTDMAQWQDAVDEAVRRFGGLDVLVNNAGITIRGSIEDYEPDAWHQVIAVNLTGVFHGMRASVEPLKRSGRGSVVNVSSTAGLQGYKDLGAYVASKYGVRGLTKSAAIDLARHNIRVNSVHPGLVRTPMVGEGRWSQDHVALRRIGEPSEVSALVLFLASDESSFSTGAEFVADGGETAGLAVLKG